MTKTVRQMYLGEVRTLVESTGLSSSSNTDPIPVGWANQITSIAKVANLTGTIDVEIEAYDPKTGGTETIVTFTQFGVAATKWMHGVDSGKSLPAFIRVKWTIVTGPADLTVVVHLKRA